MERELKRIDVNGVPELLSIAEAVRNTREPLLLRRDSEDLAVIMPVMPLKPRSRRLKTEAD